MPTHPTGRAIDLDDINDVTSSAADAINAIAETIRRLMNGRLKEEAIIILIKESLPKGSKLEKAQIKAVLDAAMNLNRYTRSPP